MNLSLDNISTVLDRMGNPERSYPAILVAGTNGKGSVTTYVSAVLRAAGLRVGSYYSPHIFRLHERIRIDGDEISSAELDDLIAFVRSRSRGVPLTYFEVLTAAAAQHFLARRVDAAVFEVGLGGRLDATNLVNAVVTVITGISRDHREHLGPTARDILDEKLGIARRGVPLVALEPETMRLRLRTPRRDYGVLETRMIGLPQTRNVATAVRAVELFEEEGFSLGRPARTVRRGIGGAFLAGRFQSVSRAPRVILDVSHNEESLLAALDTVRRISPPERTTIVFGALAHKELGAFPRRAATASREIIVTSLADRRSAPGERLGRIFGEARSRTRGAHGTVRVAHGVASAMREARRNAGPLDTILVMGSHLMVEEAAPFL